MSRGAGHRSAQPTGSAPARLTGSPRLNLLPHREMRRARRKKDFGVLAAAVAIAGAVTVGAGGIAINQMISMQQARNDFITAENAKLDRQIAEIKTLREEIAALKARQEAVENLQSDRLLPVRLLQELVRLTPEGVALRSLKQVGLKVMLTGHAQTNERVVELLRNLADSSPWVERPELVEIKEIVQATPERGVREARKIYEFTLGVTIKRQAQADAAGVKPNAVTPTAVTPTAVTR